MFVGWVVKIARSFLPRNKIVTLLFFLCISYFHLPPWFGVS